MPTSPIALPEHASVKLTFCRFLMNAAELGSILISVSGNALNKLIFKLVICPPPVNLYLNAPLLSPPVYIGTYMCHMVCMSLYPRCDWICLSYYSDVILLYRCSDVILLIRCSAPLEWNTWTRLWQVLLQQHSPLPPALVPEPASTLSLSQILSWIDTLTDLLLVSMTVYALPLTSMPGHASAKSRFTCIGSMLLQTFVPGRSYLST